MPNVATLNAVDDMTMTTSGVARLLGCSEGLVRLLANTGELPCRRIDRLRLFNRQDVLQLRARRSGELPR
jgi:excisionase family DNA binding protein